jgi:hypothetical protein
MTMTDYRASRRDDKRLEHDLQLQLQQQLADAQLAQTKLDIEAQAVEREQNRKDENAKAERDLNAATAKEEARQAKLQVQLDAKEKADKARRVEKAKAKKERREHRITFVRSVPGWVAEHLDLAAALAVMACSIVPALISQATTLNHMGLDLVMVVLLPVMLECSAWAATAAEAKALKANRAAWPYRIAAWLFALLAASINWQTGLSVGGRGENVRAAMVLAASSIVPVALWQLIQIGRHREAKAAQRVERKRLRNERRDRRARGRQYPEVWKCALRLRAIAGHGELTEQQAWVAAYAVFQGVSELTPELMVLLSAEMLGTHVRSKELIAAIFEDLERARKELLRVSGNTTDGESETVSAKALDMDVEESVYVSAGESVNPPTWVAEQSATGLLDRFGRPLFQTVSPQINPFVPAPTTAPAREPERTPVRSPRTRKEPAGRNLSEGAKKAASVSAKNTNPNENRALDEWIADSIRTSADGSTPGYGAVRAEAMRRRAEANDALPARRRAKILPEPSKTWVYERIAAGKKLAANGGLHVVRSA